jgi:hypothetical protein
LFFHELDDMHNIGLPFRRPIQHAIEDRLYLVSGYLGSLAQCTSGLTWPRHPVSGRPLSGWEDISARSAQYASRETSQFARHGRGFKN